MIKPKNEYDSSFSILYDLLTQQNSLVNGLEGATIIKEVEVEKPVYIEVEKPVEIIKEVEVIREVEKPIYIEKPVEIIKEVIVERPVEVIKEVEKIIYKYRDNNSNGNNNNGSYVCQCNNPNKKTQVKVGAVSNINKHSKNQIMHTIIPSHDMLHDFKCCATPKRKKCIFISAF